MAFDTWNDFINAINERQAIYCHDDQTHCINFPTPDLQELEVDR